MLSKLFERAFRRWGTHVEWDESFVDNQGMVNNIDPGSKLLLQTTFSSIRSCMTCMIRNVLRAGTFRKIVSKSERIICLTVNICKETICWRALTLRISHVLRYRGCSSRFKKFQINIKRSKSEEVVDAPPKAVVCTMEGDALIIRMVKWKSKDISEKLEVQRGWRCLVCLTLSCGWTKFERTYHPLVIVNEFHYDIFKANDLKTILLAGADRQR